MNTSRQSNTAEKRAAKPVSIDSTVSRRMTMVNELNSEKKFVPLLLPWAVVAGAIVVYLLSLTRWLSLGGAQNVAMVAGWNWQPEVVRPLYFLVTYPLRWLPDAWVPLALNVFSLACAVWTLALLTRTVSLLPYDRTREQRDRERSPFAFLTIPGAWIPPILAAAVCGLQLTFWEHATTASYEMLDLLLFAYVIYSLVT